MEARLSAKEWNGEGVFWFGESAIEWVDAGSNETMEGRNEKEKRRLNGRFENRTEN